MTAFSGIMPLYTRLDAPNIITSDDFNKGFVTSGLLDTGPSRYLGGDQYVWFDNNDMLTSKGWAIFNGSVGNTAFSYMNLAPSSNVILEADFTFVDDSGYERVGLMARKGDDTDPHQFNRYFAFLDYSSQEFGIWRSKQYDFVPASGDPSNLSIIYGSAQAKSIDDFYNGDTVFGYAEFGIDQYSNIRTVTDYDATNNVFTVSHPWESGIPTYLTIFRPRLPVVTTSKEIGFDLSYRVTLKCIDDDIIAECDDDRLFYTDELQTKDDNHTIVGLYASWSEDAYVDNFAAYEPASPYDASNSIPLIARNIDSAVITSDSFNRDQTEIIGQSDAYLGGEEKDWTGSNYLIRNRELWHLGIESDSLFLDVEQKNFKVEFDFEFPGNGFIGIAVRQQSGGDDWVYCLYNATTSTMIIYEVIDSISTVKDSELIALSQNTKYTATVKCWEDNIQFTINNTTIEYNTTNPSSISADENTVISFYSTIPNAKFDNLIVTDIDYSDSIPLFLKIYDIDTKEAPLFTKGKDELNKNIPLYTINFETENSGIPLFTKGIFTNTNKLTLYTNSVPNPSSTNSMPLWMYSTTNDGLFNSIPLFLGDGYNTDWTLTLFAKTQESASYNETISLFLGSYDDQINDYIPLFVKNEWIDSNANIPLSISGYGTTPGALPYNNKVTLFVERDTEKIVNNISMFLKTAEENNKSISIYMSGSGPISSSGIPLVIQNVIGEHNDNIPIYTHGF